MPIDYFLNKERGFIYIKPTGEVSLRDLLKHQNIIASHPDFAAASFALLDFSELSLTNIRFKLVAAITKHDPCGQGFRRAIVAPSLAAYGIARMFQTLMGKQHGEVAAFRELSAAKQWLGLEEDDPIFSSTVETL